jgi:hypothetical protein
MRKVLASIIIGLFLGVLFAYLVGNLSPWNETAVFSYLEKYDISKGVEFEQFIDESIRAGLIFDFLNIGNIVILALIGSSAFISFFCTVHMVIDKLFFKKFWQEPDHGIAIRRGSWIPIIFIIFSGIRLFGGFTSINLAFIAFAVIVILYVEISFTRGESQIRKELNKDEEPISN